MSKHDPILLYASRLLPASVAMEASALYAWCRRLDEITDNPLSTAKELQVQLEDWQNRFDLLAKGEPVDAMDAALYECLQRNPNIGTDPFCDMMDGMKADAVVEGQRRIQSMEELETYGYQVAGTVGLMLLPLLKAPKEAKDPAVALGTAIQLINILRDATPDAALGRIYLPQDLLQANGVQNEDVVALQSSDGYRQVVRQVAGRAEDLLREAEVGKSTLPGLGPLLVQIIVELYRGYLEQLEKLEYNNLKPGGERVRISTGRKLAATLKALGTMIGGAKLQ
jgi:phytoene synthase